jgi:hypothetical protein
LGLKGIVVVVVVLLLLLLRLLCVCLAGDFTIASDRLRRYIAIGSSLATARAHKVRQYQRAQVHARMLARGAAVLVFTKAPDH